MKAIKAHFDGERIVVPDELKGCPAGDVIVVFDEKADAPDHNGWQRAQQEALAKAWDNDEDAVYDEA